MLGHNFIVIFDVEAGVFDTTHINDFDAGFEVPVGGASCEHLAGEMVAMLDVGAHQLGQFN